MGVDGDLRHREAMLRIDGKIAYRYAMKEGGAKMCDCDCNGPEISTVKVVKARKTHKCGECRREIAPGFEYENTWGIWDGESSTHKTCLGCVELRKWADDQVECLCWEYGRLHGSILDELHECDPKNTGVYAEAEARIKNLRAQRSPSDASEGVT